MTGVEELTSFAAVMQASMVAGRGAPMDLALAAAATGRVVPEGGAAELARLQALMNAQPANLTEAQVEALIDAGNAALADYYHERACACRDYPEGCATNPQYRRAGGFWDTDAFAVSAPAVIGLWEVLRAPGDEALVGQLRARIAALEDVFLADSAKIRRLQDNQDIDLPRLRHAVTAWSVRCRDAQEEARGLRIRTAELEARAAGPVTSWYLAEFEGGEGSPTLHATVESAREWCDEFEPAEWFDEGDVWVQYATDPDTDQPTYQGGGRVSLLLVPESSELVALRARNAELEDRLCACDAAAEQRHQYLDPSELPVTAFIAPVPVVDVAPAPVMDGAPC